MAKRSFSGGGKRAGRGTAGRSSGGSKRRTSGTAGRKSDGGASASASRGGGGGAKRAAGAARRGGGASTGRRAAGKVGANRKAARAVGGSLDFGIKPADAARRAARGESLDPERGASTRAARPGVNVPRDAGAGKPDSGPGSNSGGDLDTDFTGVGTGGGLAQDPPTSVTQGPASSDGSSDEFASGPKARGRNQLPRGTHGASKRPRGPTVNTGTAGTDAGGSLDGGYAGDVAMGGTKTNAIAPLAGGPDSGADAARGQPGRGDRTDESNRTNSPPP